MGVDVADINHDGHLDLYITDLYPSAMFMNNGDGTFDDVSVPSGTNDSGMTWGASFSTTTTTGIGTVHRERLPLRPCPTSCTTATATAPSPP